MVTSSGSEGVPSTGGSGVDADGLRRRYAEERGKRQRADGNDQYREVAGLLSVFEADPLVERPLVREPLDDEVDVLIVGAGFGGLLVGARLREAGVGRIRIVDKAGDVGGTWYWNRYPGVQCDIESYIYLPLLEEMGYVPELKYSFGPEILAYSQAIARRYGLYDQACFQTEVTGMVWDEESRRWVVATDRHDQMRARFVVTASGPLNRPKLPGIAGLESFAGHTFHTSRWDYAYTGGSRQGVLDGLSDKRVGIIGTGATAIQCVPHLGAAAEHLYVFQRTPSSVDERGNRRTDPAWAASLAAGWQRRRMENFAILVAGGHQDEDLVDDGWTDITKMAVFLGRADGADAVDLMTASELADFAKMERLRARVDAIVEDPATAEALKPWYRVFCKRPCFNDEYLDTFNRPNVTLVDTDGRGVDRITENAVVVGDTSYRVDCLIFATGFEVGTSYIRRAGFDVMGRGGARLSDKWADGLRTFHGFHSAGFPNLFHLGVTQTGITVNVSHMLTEQSEHIAYIVRRCLREGFDMVEATLQAEDDWVATIRRLSPNNQKFLQECTPGYFNNEGRPGNPHSLQAGQYGLGAQAFFDLLHDWRKDGTLHGLALTPAIRM